MNGDEIFLEIIDNGDFIKVTPQGFTYPDTDNEWDSKWLRAEVQIKVGAFAGNYIGEFMNVDFFELRKHLTYLYDHLGSSFTFEPLESYLKLTFKGDGLGHIELFCQASDNPGWNASNFEFYLNIDQTFIPKLINQLDLIIEEYR
jgi:hypothetical protein